MNDPLRTIFLTLCASFISLAHAQPDTLYVTSGDSTYSYPVIYDPIRPLDQFQRIGRYAFDTTRVAVQLDYKRGKPSGVYRAFYPDGKPLIFAVYGWGSLNGDWTEYDEFGRVTIKGQYRDGQRNGTWAFRTQGILGHYKDGLKSGKWKYFGPDGKVLRIERYREGKLRNGSTYNFPP